MRKEEMGSGEKKSKEREVMGRSANKTLERRRGEEGVSGWEGRGKREEEGRRAERAR
jgi:hypothetical protein